MEKYYSEISVPSNIKYLELALNFVDYASRNIGFFKDDITKIHLAAEEFIATIIETAAISKDESIFQVVCKRIPTGIEIIINEKGLPYDLNQLPRFNPEESLENQTGAGLGLFLIKKMMDEFEIENLGVEGRTARLIKHLPQSKITDIIDEKSATPFDDEQKIPARKNVEFNIRNINENEAIAVSQCIYKAYGYSYLSEHVYYPERIIALNKSGHFMTAVAVTNQNEFAGTCQLTVEENAAVASLGQAAVKPEFRNNRCLQHLTSYLIDKAQKRNIYGLFVEAVANHKFSQLGAHKAGMKDCSILLGYCPASMKFAKIGEIEGERTSIVQSYMKISETPIKNIYPPHHHKKMISEIYENIGVEVNVATPPKEIDLPQKSVIKTKYMNTALSATIRVVEAGRDLLVTLQQELKDICLKKYEAIFLHLSLEKPKNDRFVKEIERLGFFFSGVLPNDTTGDSLILQYLNNVDVTISKLDLASEFTQRLAAYIETCKENHPLKQLIMTGESEHLEFKSTLRWNLKTDKKDSALEISVMKTIAAFLNSKGGTLLVGVEDSGNILGIESDNFKNEDKFLLHFATMIQNYIGIEHNDFIEYSLVEAAHKQVLQVDCIESPKPVFLKNGIQEDFYIRSEPLSLNLNTKKAVMYISEHFGK